MKKNLLVFSIAILVMGCAEDFLEKKPIGKETSDSFLGNPATADENFEKMIVAAYETFNFEEGQWDGVGHHGEWMWDIVTDDAQKGGDGAGNQAWMLDWRNWVTKPTSMGPAKSAYITFNVAKERANTILEYCETYKSTLSPEKYKKIKGEALFIRAYFHFYGVKMFGSFPYYSEPIKADEYKNPASMQPEEIYANIEADLTEAVELLEEKSVWMDKFNVWPEGRATKGAARAILARVIAMEIGFGYNNKTWTDLYEVTDAIIKSGQYALVPNFATIFEMEGMNSSESVFEVQCANLQQGWGKPGGNSAPIMRSPRLTCGQNNGKNMYSGWGFCLPTPSLVNEFETGDPRKNSTIIFNNDILWEDGNPETNERIDITVKDKCPTFMFSRKYSVSPANKPDGNMNSSVNKRVVRYADVLLLHAEAAYHIGKEGEARLLVNQIRARARQSTLPLGSQLLNPGYQTNPAGSNILPDVTASGTDLLLAIKHERRVELAHEGHRLWDLIRWGDYENAIKIYVVEDYLLSPKDPDGSIAVENFRKHLIDGKVPCFPIPYEDVENFGVQQNPNY